jgi:hypothetical protein
MLLCAGEPVAKGVRIRSRDKGYDALTKRIYGFGKVHLKVGVFSTDPKVDHDGKAQPVTVVMVAEWMEFGVPGRIPARSFIRAWFDENKPECQVQIAKALRAVTRGAITKERALALLGERFAAGMKARVAQGIPPENAPSTVARKGSSVPLIDTGQLRSSITFQVVL